MASPSLVGLRVDGGRRCSLLCPALHSVVDIYEAEATAEPRSTGSIDEPAAVISDIDSLSDQCDLTPASHALTISHC